MSKPPILHVVEPTEPEPESVGPFETDAEHSARLHREALEAGHRAVGALMENLAYLRDEARVIAELQTVRPGEREYARRVGDFVEATLRGLYPLHARKP